jgi:5-methylcytosine-specific restriction protein B
MGEYEYKPDSEIRYPHFRSVEWIFKDEEIPAEEIYNTGLTQRSIYKMDESGIKKDFFVNQSATLSKTENNTAPDNFVLIIDEINRGNVSSILGELITLIEKDKRKGGAEELETTLPYSKAPFSVPNNLYIIGTMNTADRSVEALDSALRRRFEFEEIAPNALLPLLDYEVYGLPTSNSKTDEDSDDTDSSVNAEAFVQNAFYSNIIPLLQEYFFGDVAKIGLILGKGFVQEVTSDSEKKGFAEFEYPGIDDFDEIKRYKIIDYRDKEELEGVVSGFAQALSTMMGK